MDHRRTLQLGTALIATALLFRLTDAGMLQSMANFLAQPNITSFLIYLETGRIVRFSQSSDTRDAFALESPAPDFAHQEEEKPAFAPSDADGLAIRYNCSHRPNLAGLLTRPLDWNLTADEPTVLIIHTHATESYTKAPGEDYRETSAFRTLDEDYNMISIGAHLASLLEAGGITVLHDRQLHDYPSYNGSYNHSRAAVKAHLEEHPSIRLVLDLHRDASGDNRNQMRTHAKIKDQDSAQLMLVVGTDASGLKHPAWEENLALGLKLQVQMERRFPGIMRYVNLRGQRFNQDLIPGMLLVEVGAAGNSHTEALRAVSALAEGILDLARGCEITQGE